MRRLAILLLLLPLTSCQRPQEEEPPLAWERYDLFVHKPEVEVQAPRVRRSWVRRIAYYGSREVRNAKTVSPSHFERVKQLPASEIRALEQVLGSRLRWPLEIGQEGFFSFIPLRDERLHLPVDYRISIRTADGNEHVLRTLPAPTLVPPGQATEYVDLGSFAGQNVDLLLEMASPVTGQDLAGRRRGMWGSPAVTSRKAMTGASPGSAKRPNVLLIGVDTLRADALGAYGASPSVTPALDRLAAESDVWLDAISCFNVTNPSFLSLMTGLYGKNHGIYNLTTQLAEEHETLAEIFSGAGYETLAVISARHLGPQASGIGQGFGDVFLTDRHYTAELAVDLTMEWIAQRKEPPFFAWTHLFDPHTPHTPPAPYAFGFHAEEPTGMSPPTGWSMFRNPGLPPYVQKALGGQKDLYAGEVAYVDRQIDRLVDFLDSRNLLETTILVFIADHGENLEDHGIYYGHHGLFETTTHVPLMIRWPGRREGRRLEGLVQNIDVFPTLLEATGIEGPEVDGEDLLKSTGSDRRGRRVAFSEHAHHTGVRVRTPDFSYSRSYGNPFVEDGTYLFDLRTDPGELVNLAGTGLEQEAELERLLEGWLAQRRTATKSIPGDLSEEDVDRLRALGYL